MATTSECRRAGGFTLSDLVVLTVVLAAGAAIPVAARAQYIGLGRKTACLANLEAHGVAFAAYKEANRGKLPALYVGADPGAALRAPVGTSGGTSWGSPDSGFRSPADRAAALSATGSNAMQNMWLIIDGDYMGGGEAAYKCPDDRKWSPRAHGSLKFGWTSPYNFSYSIQFPYAGSRQVAVTGSGPGRYELPGASAKPPKPDATWNWADPNGVVLAQGDNRGKPMYPDSGVYMADRNPRTTWTGPCPGNSNHDDGVCYVEKSGTSGKFATTDGKGGPGGDDIYVNRNVASPGGLPYVPPTGLDPAGFAKSPCTDTVLWPLNARQ